MNMFKSLLEKYKVVSFDNIIGQENNINFLKNSLFKGVFYPLYLFSGMRGSGKTSCARLFSSALLCDNLNIFQGNPHQVNIPCYKCQSCLLAAQHKHPDIIELDAASHTGVDTIRAIIDNAYMLPIIGSCKIYIIDEVHMLSKAAFNACLKIMEEPPSFVYFILATTEIQKVLETVRSRSIILNFKPLNKLVLFDYISKIAYLEKIEIEEDAVQLITEISEGSVRDSLNILNRLMLIGLKISKKMVTEEYGIAENEDIIRLIDIIIDGDREQYYIQKSQMDVAELGKKKCFQKAVEYVQLLLKKEIINTYDNKKIIQIRQILYQLYQYEEYFYVSNSPLGIFDLIFSENVFESRNNSQIILPREEKKDNFEIKNELKINNSEYQSNDKILIDEINFVNRLPHVIKTIFNQGKINIDRDLFKVFINFKKNFSFYKTFLQKDKEQIESILHSTIGEKFSLEYQFTLDEINNTVEHSSIKKNEIIMNNDIIKNKIQKTNYVVGIEKNKVKKKVVDLPLLLIKINDFMPGITYYR